MENGFCRGKSRATAIKGLRAVSLKGFGLIRQPLDDISQKKSTAGISPSVDFLMFTYAVVSNAFS